MPTYSADQNKHSDPLNDDHYKHMHDDDFRSWLVHRQATLRDCREGGLRAAQVRDVVSKALIGAKALLRKLGGRILRSITATKLWRLDRELMFRGGDYRRFGAQWTRLQLDRSRAKRKI